VTETSHMAHPVHTLQPVKDTYKSDSNERYWTEEDEAVFRPYLPSNCSGVSETIHVVLHASALKAVQIRFKSVSNKGHYTLEAETVFRPI
jgi:hypothetical protein